MKKILQKLLIVFSLLVVLSLTACKNNPEPTELIIEEAPIPIHREAKRLTWTVKDQIDGDDNFVKSGNYVNLTIAEELPSDLILNNIKWYAKFVDGEKFIGQGKTVSYKTEDNTNIRYKVYAQINDGKYEATTGLYSFIATTKPEYQDYIKKIYEHIDLNNFQLGVSVSIYSKSNGVKFDFFDGLAKLNTNTRNTSATQHFLGSVSKSFTAASVISLFAKEPNWEQITINDVLTSTDLIYAPKDAINGTETIQQLMTHTSGIGDNVGLGLVLDLLGQSNSLANAISILLGYSSPLDWFAQSTWTPARLLKHITVNKHTDTDNPVLYSSPGYVILGMMAEKELLLQSITDLNTYMATTFFNNPKLNLHGMKLTSPENTTDLEYKSYADPHIITSQISSLVRDYTTITDAELNVLLALITKGDIYSFTSVEPDINKLLSKGAWSAGAIVGTSENAANWGYNIMCKNASDSDLTDVNGVNIHDIMRESVLSATPESKYGYGLIKRNLSHNDETYELIGHSGRIIGNCNLMYYFDDTDTCYSVFIDSVHTEDPVLSKVGLNEEHLLCDLCSIDVDRLSN